ncbi:Similar to Putative membrane-bound O-acyltransferase C24H6.01c; acc. no. Q09758 [Pyronema omphalodes CBS 100304]|uniref:Similar to Putative membrane-bound O-acyltransferase C24H6.01c acc. no. Q09758 n=1 Tax=Pyronema omphalodes (strain CBS 100304) TaxID=1076935 RepID=U4LWD9_PYROM|nr:Similar to Putative membrane-bound O-acyltransferase C24H6.01c; acc. no. Q09758 [Pyronema omphalodes CBS 100304]
MGLFSGFSQVFSLDTLDYRLTANTLRSSSPPKNHGRRQPSVSASSTTENESPASRKLREESKPSKWFSIEFFFYYIVFIVVVPLMFKVVIDVSKESHPNFPKYKHLLSPGWIPGRKVDNSDAQYQSFRNNIPILFAVLTLHSVLRRVFNVVYSRISPTPPTNSSYYASHNLNRRKIFDIIFALIFLTALHSLSVIKILVILLVNFSISFFHPSSIMVPICTWVFNITVLFANEYYSGYRYRDLLPFFVAGEGAGFGYWMDHFMGGGLLRRWEVSFKITVLRLISYNLDHYWAACRAEAGEEEEGSVLELKYSTPTLTIRRRLLYAVRLVIAILTMELALHYIYVVAISKTSSRGSWAGDTPAQLAMIGYFNLHIIWLKLLIPWRFFRLWSLVDGIDPPENMLRCMSNNFSALAFWRAWHRSFNRWIVRYIYIPLGGAKRPVINMAAVFTFVALWHDISLKLLAWGWLVVLFVIPEIVGHKIARRWQSNVTFARHMAALGGVANVLMMMAANLVGFAIGLDGLRTMVDGVFGSYGGAAFIIFSMMAIFVGVQVMFEIREAEKRHGINLKC